VYAGRSVRYLAPLLALALLAVLSPACGQANPTEGPGLSLPTSEVAPTETTPAQKRTPDQPKESGEDTLVVRSFPPGHGVYAVPEGVADTLLGAPPLDYLVGATPLEIALDPGAYCVYVEHAPTRYRNDGIHEIALTLVELSESGLKPTAKVYHVTKEAGHQAIVTALLWPEGQSAEDFVASLPDEDLFHFSLDDVAAFLELHHIPREDWDLLLSMLNKTGKAAWYGNDPLDDYLVIYVPEPGRIYRVCGGSATPAE
jgi:hypothetical protein